jgi:hypothetical protein
VLATIAAHPAVNTNQALAYRVAPENSSRTSSAVIRDWHNGKAAVTRFEPSPGAPPTWLTAAGRSSTCHSTVAMPTATTIPSVTISRRSRLAALVRSRVHTEAP